VLRGTTARPPFGQKIVPIFSFFLVWAGTLWALVTSTKGAGKTEVFSGKVFSGKYFIIFVLEWNQALLKIIAIIFKSSLFEFKINLSANITKYRSYLFF
jgi:hypothetical protein